jgi:parvulin-like peptidyl-prolyl isomerase
MKAILLLLISGFWLSATAQESPTPQQAKAFLAAHINAEADISEYNKTYELLKDHKPGVIVIDGKNIYKIVEPTTISAYNAGYIFLDTKKFSEAQIQQLTDDIFSQYGNGIPFRELIEKFSMDKNPNAVELKFTEGQMVPAFEKAVKEHKAGEIFTVPTPEKGWLHIVRKNEDNRQINAIRVEYAVYKS